MAQTPSPSDFSGTFTYRNDNARTGQNLQEVVLTPATVNQGQFGKIFSRLMDMCTPSRSMSQTCHDAATLQLVAMFSATPNGSREEFGRAAVDLQRMQVATFS
jgi:hypothetical protein